MPTILTKGLGYDEPSIIYHDVATELVGSVVAVARLVGVAVPEEPPKARVVPTIPIFGKLTADDCLVGTLVSRQFLIGILKEDGPLMTLEANKITMFLRDDRTLLVSVNTDKSEPVNLTNAKIWFTVKERATDDDSRAIIRKRNAAAGGSDSEIRITDAAGGKAEIYIVPADTAQVNPGTYRYDVQVVLANGKTYTVVRDQLILKEDITKTQS